MIPILRFLPQRCPHCGYRDIQAGYSDILEFGSVSCYNCMVTYRIEGKYIDIDGDIIDCRTLTGSFFDVISVDDLEWT